MYLYFCLDCDSEDYSDSDSDSDDSYLDVDFDDDYDDYDDYDDDYALITAALAYSWPAPALISGRTIIIDPIVLKFCLQKYHFKSCVFLVNLKYNFIILSFLFLSSTSNSFGMLL